MDKSERYLRLLQLLENLQNPEWGRLTWVDFRDTSITELRTAGFTRQELNTDLQYLLQKYLDEDTVSGYYRCHRIANWIKENENYETLETSNT